MSHELIVSSPGQIELNKYKECKPGDNEVFIRSEYSACKHGTESWVLSGNAHWMNRKRDRKMRIFTDEIEGSVYPTKLGDVCVGIVEDIGNEVKNIKNGDRVFFYAGARDTHIVHENLIRVMPEKMTWKEAFCFDPLEFAYGAVRDSNMKLGDKVGVFGLGAIGLLAIQLCRLQGAETIVAVDPVKARRELAEEVGADFVFNPDEIDVGLEIRRQVSEIGLDSVIDFSGVTRSLHNCIRSTAYGGYVVAGSMYKPATEDLKLGMEFHWNNIKIVSSRACNEPNPEYPRWDRDRIHKAIWNLLVNNKILTDSIIQPVVPFNEAVDHYNKIATDPDKYIKLTFKHY